MPQQSEKSDSLAVFLQYGVTFNKRAENESISDCPFSDCRKKNKFYVDVNTGLWKCFVCGKEGNQKGFIEAILKQAQTETKSGHEHYKTLAVNRGFNVGTLRHFNIGYNTLNQTYLLPIYNWDYTKLVNVKIYDMEKKNFTNTSGMHSALFSSKEFFKTIIEKQEVPVWICEGEWDGMAMYEALMQTEEKAVFVSVPSAGVFKSEWVQLFHNRKIFLGYDNDDAGRAGGEKAYKTLEFSASSVQCLHWLPSEEFSPKIKGDIRDCYIALGTEKMLEYLKENLRSEPFGFSTEENVSVSDKNKSDAPDIERTDAQAVRELYAGWLHLPDLDIIDVLFGTALANRLSGDPLWMFLIAPAGGTKTEFCMSLSECSCVECLSSLTPHTLVSGANFGGGDPSLLPRLRDRILVIKDFTTILNLHPTDREAIFGILRDAYDGEFTKSFGNGITRH
jgi:hypothetical protein